MSDDERKISFDTGINLDGLDNDTKELKSMANDIARTIENMGKDIEDNVSGINMDRIQSSMQYMDVRNPYEMTKTEVYVGDRKAEFVEADTDGKVYWSLEFSRIEV